MEAWGLSDTGNVRKQNQDYYNLIHFGPECLLAIICDGMGGAKSGNVASHLAADAFQIDFPQVRLLFFFFLGKSRGALLPGQFINPGNEFLSYHKSLSFFNSFHYTTQYYTFRPRPCQNISRPIAKGYSGLV